MGVVLLTPQDSTADLAPGRSVGASSADTPARQQREQEARTRDRVLAMVSENGPVTAAALAGALRMTATGVRRHLDGLQEEGLVAVADHATGGRGRGRPARAYVLTSAGHERMATEYDDVATAALRYLTEAIGPTAVTEFAQRRIAELERRYAGEVAAAGPVLADRVHALANALARDGFAASTRPVATVSSGSLALAPVATHGVQLCQGHCPMHQVAAEFPQFCEVETEAFARLLGVHVQRLSTLAGGGHVCTTYIPQSTGVPASAPAATTSPQAGHELHPAPEEGTTP